MTSVMKTAGRGETLVILSKQLCLCLRKKRYNHKEKWSLDSRLANKVDWKLETSLKRKTNGNNVRPYFEYFKATYCGARLKLRKTFVYTSDCV